MNESEKQNDFDIRELSLIDVSFEDDCLISSPFANPPHCTFSENQEHKSVKFLEPFDAINVETSFNSSEEREQGSQPPGSSEPEKTRSGKYNLRKSLAWDNAFFTSEGFLEPEELSSMIGGTEKSEKRVLPGIQEDIHRYTDSLSTLDSDTLILKSLEVDLFEDIRASIQKSSKASNVANSNTKKKLVVGDSQTIQSLKKVDLASRDKMKPKTALKMPTVGTQGSGKTSKQGSVRLQASQSVATNGQLTTSPCKPPKVQSRNSPILTISTKRASLGANRIKMEKDHTKNASGRGAPPKIPSSVGSWNILHRPTPPSRSLRSSAVTKTELTTSCSSFDSSGSGSSGSPVKLSLNSIKRKNDSGTQSRSSSGLTVKSTSKTALRSKSQPGSSHLTAYLRSVTKLSSSISPNSSISEWSSESTSSTATANRRPTSTRTSLDSSSSIVVSANSDAAQVLDSHSNSNDHHLVGDGSKFPCLQGEHVKGASMRAGGLLCPPSSKTSGLRKPSPKIGFFDGVRSGGHSPNASVQSHSGVPSVLPRIGAGSINPNAGPIKAKLGKFQSTETALVIQGTKQTTLTVKPRPALPLQAPSNASIKVSSVSRNVKSPLISPKFQSRMSPKTGRESLLRAGEAEFKVYDISTLETPCVLKNKVSPESKSTTAAVCMNFNPISKSLHTSGDLHPIHNAENINPSQKVIGDAKLGQLFLNNDLNQVNDLTRQVEAIDMNVKVKKTVSSLFPERILPEGS